jgi:hypothetical protein
VEEPALAEPRQVARDEPLDPQRAPQLRDAGVALAAEHLLLGLEREDRLDLLAGDHLGAAPPPHLGRQRLGDRRGRGGRDAFARGDRHDGQLR